MAAQPANFSALGRALVAQGKLAQSEANAIHMEATKQGVSFIQQLVASKKATAKEISLFAVVRDDLVVDQGERQGSHNKIVANHRVIALGKRGNRIFVAMSDPSNEQVLQEVKFATGLTMEPVVVEDDKLASVVRKLTDSASKTIESITEDVDLSGIEVSDGETKPEVTTEEIDDAPVVKHVQKLLLDAVNGGAPV